MGFIGGWIAQQVLSRVARRGDGRMDGSAYAGRSKLEVLLGPEVWERCRGRTVIDFGCGEGHEAVELARHGAATVIGIDVLEPYLERARRLARDSGEHERCTFTTTPDDQRADVIVALDSFEHFQHPAQVLRIMHRYLAPGGQVLVSFGPTWFHPLGGHLFSVFPWAHLIFTERALIRWRSTFKSDGATRFGEVAGGLNQMTIRRFCRLVEESPLRFQHFEPVPIRRIARLHNRFTREFTTAIVRATLVARNAA